MYKVTTFHSDNLEVTMIDELDRELTSAGAFLRPDPGVESALSALVDARARDVAKSRPHRVARLARGSRLTAVLSIGAVLAAGGAGAVAASQWGPWTYVTEPDLVVARDWTDTAGHYLGSCESRLSIDTLPADARSLAVDYLDSVDVDAIEPDPEWVAGLLHAVGRLDTIGTLVAGARPTDFEPGGDGWSGPALDYFSDARILQDALTQKVFTGMSDVLVERMPGLDYDWKDITARIETQCSTDPGHPRAP
jgi:hypothetical protein